VTTVTNNELNVQLVEGYLDWTRMRNLVPSTTLNYGSLLRAWLGYLGDKDCRRATPEDVTDFMRRPRARRARGQMGSASTRNRDAAILSSFYKFLINIGEMEKNPVALAPRAKVRGRSPQALPDETWFRVWEGAGELDRLWLGLGWFCGLRANEIVNLRGEQFRDEAIVAFPRKSGRENTWPLGEVAADYRARLPFDVDGWLRSLTRTAQSQGSRPVVEFDGYQVTEGRQSALRYASGALQVPTVLNKRLTKLLRRLDVAHFGPHALRHSAITNWLRMGYPLPLVMVLADHRSADVTSGYLAGSRRMLADWRANSS